MASTIPKQSSAKQLGELLQEQQEPFILEIYLLEKGYMKNKLNLQSGFRNSNSRFLNKLTTQGSNRRRKVVPTCPKIVRAVLKKLVSIINKQTMKNSVDEDGESSAEQEKPESDGLSSASLQTWRSPISPSDQELNINSFFESNIEDGLYSLPRDSVSVTADTCRSFKLGDVLQEKEDTWLSLVTLTLSGWFGPLECLELALEHDPEFLSLLGRACEGLRPSRDHFGLQVCWLGEEVRGLQWGLMAFIVTPAVSLVTPATRFVVLVTAEVCFSCP
ncbi:hypothetical protein HYC85_020432 [Camellia sinensis]|uniref:Uncharacterized protein n=1 Tax=Camellia sinensis TaxID=4442 RepID=A0A7J7GQ09_CAMSI|nr:hypothetical protein HYC85_020432 [Camellia sinensis]